MAGDSVCVGPVGMNGVREAGIHARCCAHSRVTHAKKQCTTECDTNEKKKKKKACYVNVDRAGECLYSKHSLGGWPHWKAHDAAKLILTRAHPACADSCEERGGFRGTCCWYLILDQLPAERGSSKRWNPATEYWARSCAVHDRHMSIIKYSVHCTKSTCRCNCGDKACESLAHVCHFRQTHWITCGPDEACQITRCRIESRLMIWNRSSCCEHWIISGRKCGCCCWSGSAMIFNQLRLSGCVKNMENVSI